MSVTRSKKFIEPAEADLRGGRSVQALQIGCQFAAKKLNELIKKDLGRNNLEPFNRISSPGSIARSVRRSSALLADVEAASGPYTRNHVRASLSAAISRRAMLTMGFALRGATCTIRWRVTSIIERRLSVLDLGHRGGLGRSQSCGRDGEGPGSVQGSSLIRPRVSTRLEGTAAWGLRGHRPFVDIDCSTSGRDWRAPLVRSQPCQCRHHPPTGSRQEWPLPSSAPEWTSARDPRRPSVRRPRSVWEGWPGPFHQLVEH